MKKTTPESKSIQRRKAIMKKDDAEKNVVSPFFTVSLVSVSDKIIGKGKTIIEALDQFPKNTTFKSRATITVKCGEKQSQITMQPFEITRLLSKEINKTFFAKRMISIMK